LTGELKRQFQELILEVVISRYLDLIEGKVKICSRIEGSVSYYGSYAETYLIVEKPISAGQQLEPELTEPTTATEALLITAEVTIFAIVAVACIIGVVALLTLRKRK
jgi:hypothetical protein